MPARGSEFAAESAAAEFTRALEQDAHLYGVTLAGEQLAALAAYYRLLRRWNPRLHLVAPASLDDPRVFARRHVLESLFALPALADSGASLADVGSGGGLPAVPLLVARSDLRATLVEADTKKCVFLREALAACGCAGRASVVARRFEDVPPPGADALTTRALERFAELLPRLLAWSGEMPLLLLFGGEELRALIPDDEFRTHARRIPASERRFLYVLRRRDATGGSLSTITAAQI